MPVDSTFDWVQSCEEGVFGKHIYDVYYDGTHAFRCHCGMCTVLPHNGIKALALQELDQNGDK